MSVGGRFGAWVAPVAVLALLGAHSAAAAVCGESFDAAAQLSRMRVTLKGDGETRVDLPAASPQDTLVYAVEQGVDVELEIHDAAGGVLARADSPVARIGRQRAFLPASGKAPAFAIVRGREHAGVAGAVTVTMVRVGASAEGADCTGIERSLAAADQAYAQARANSRSLLEAAAVLYENIAQTISAQPRSDDRGEIQLTLAALYYYDLQDWARSARWADAAATTFRGISPYRRARAQAILAAAWMEQATKSSASGQSSAIPAESHALFEKSRALLAQLEAFHGARREPYDRALQINNIGLAYLYEARFEAALPHFEHARVEFEKLGEMQRAAVAIENMALCEWGLGRLSAALPMFDRALSLMSPQPYPDLYLLTLSSSALAHHGAGRFDDSLRLNGQVIDLATRLQMDRIRARGYYGMGITYYAIGDRELATRFLRSALEILTPDVDARTRVASLRALAVIEWETGDYKQAAAHDSEALRLATAPSARSRILLRLAADYAAQGDVNAAFTVLDSLAKFPPNGDALVQALALAQRAKLHRAAGALEPARRDVTQALRTLRRFDAVTDEFEAYVELARIERDAGNDAAALRALNEALGHTGEITSQTANPEYRASIAQSVRPALDLKIDLLWKRYQRLTDSRDTAAAREAMLESLRTADNSRALAFEELRSQRLDDASDPKIGELQRTIAALYRDIAERRYQLASREDRFGTDEITARKLREDISRLRARLGVVEGDLAARTIPASKRPTGVARDWIARALAEPADRALIEYWVGSTASYAWTIAGGDLTWMRLASTAQIDKAARNLHETMRSYATTPVRARLEAGAELYRLLFAPIRAQLAGRRALTIVPDGPLHYVPFGTMRDPSLPEKSFVAQRFSIELAPALRLAVSDRAPAPASWASSRMLLVADPVYSADDPRLARSSSTQRPSDKLSDLLRMRTGADPAKLERLVASARESEQIRSLSGLPRIDLLEGFDATRANVLAQDLSQYRFIHIASHGFIDSEIPQLSALILGAWDRNGRVADQYVRAGDLLARTFDAEVVVLSACDTALGRQVSGEGLVGLRYAALARGARSVVASLWPVSDAIAADLMTDMYRYITVEHYPVAAALGAAVRAALARTPALDPALWGPFAVYVAGH
ncbi:MAG TPA: CHAT domain-containing tetratricopeptide repeat protein [Steroidobacteraceae bacterium]|nr:CHAT domain-containing tetratricopeptide repeat protein [Steroidobacteraceae bacterium]